MSADPASNFPERIRLAGDPMNEDEARLITAQINAYAINLPKLVKEAKDAEAWRTLGYSSWQEYVTEALVISRQYADLLVKHAAKAEELSDATGLPVDLFTLPERATRPLPASTMVDIAAEVVADLPPATTDAEKAAVVDAAIRAEGSKAVEAARARREREAADAEAAAFARGAALAEQAAEPEQEPAPVPAPNPAPHAPQAASPAGLIDAQDATGSDSAPDPVAPSTDGGQTAAPVAPVGVTTPPGWDWDVVFAMSPKAAALLHLTEPVDVAVIDDALTWCHLFFAALKEMAA